jgi:hypothetical protein
MKILIACEESQAVCKAFREKGHKAFSCDIEPCSGGLPEFHLQCDVNTVLNEDWDMIIAFPPCTHLASSGAAHFAQKRADGRQQQGIDFFMLFANHPCPKICIENPVGIMSNVYRKPDQIIEPYMFGFPATKKTCLWLKGLPKLVPTNIVQPDPPVVFKSGKRMDAWFYKTSNVKRSERGKVRSKTFLGVAEAMANQWG